MYVWQNAKADTYHCQTGWCQSLHRHCAENGCCSRHPSSACCTHIWAHYCKPKTRGANRTEHQFSVTEKQINPNSELSHTGFNDCHKEHFHPDFSFLPYIRLSYCNLKTCRGLRRWLRGYNTCYVSLITLVSPRNPCIGKESTDSFRMLSDHHISHGMCVHTQTHHIHI